MNKNITSKSGLAKKVKVLEKENAKLKFSEIQIIDKVDNPVVSTDIKGYITNWNKGAEQLLKYSKKEALGKHISFIYPDRQEKLFMENLIRPLIEKGTLKTKVLTKRKSGENLYTNILLLLIKSVGNNEIRIIGSSADAKEYRLEDIFKKSKEELIIILNSIKDGVIVTDYKGKIIRMNPVSEQLSGWKFDQAKTQTFEKIFNIIDNKTGKKIKTSIDYITDINDNSDISLISKNGLLHRISYKATNIKGGNGKIIGAVVVFHDIMEKYILSKALQDSEGKYKTFISNFPGIVFRSDLYFKPLFFHGKVKDITGYTEQDFLSGKIIWDKIIHPDDLPKLLKDTKKINIYPNIFYENEYRIIRKDKGIRYVRQYVGNVSNDLGKPVFTEGVVYDITEHKLAEMSRYESEEKYHNILENANEAIFVIQDGVFKFFNPQLLKMSGYSKKELLLFPFEKFIHPEDREMVVKQHKLRLRGEKLKHIYSFKAINKKGKTLIAEINAVLITWENRPAILIFMNDITKRKMAEQALKKNERNYKILIESSSDGIAVHNGEKFLYVNQTFLKIFGGKKADEFKKIHPVELIQGPEYVKINKERLQKVKNGIKVPFMEFPFKSPFNRKIIKIETKPILFNDNGEKLYQIILRDMSAEKKLMKEQMRVKLAKESNLKLKKEINSRQEAEEKLKESLKEKEILFKEVHHRVKNNMQVISSILNLQSHSIKDPKIRRLFEESQDRIKSMALVHENLYKTKNINKIDFDDYIKTLIDNLFRTYGVNNNIFLNIKKSNVYLSLEVGIPCGLIINELISNSVKHAFKNKNKNSIFVKLIKLPDSKLELTVKDNGIGIDSSIDIYNTKSMGLQLVTTLVEQINGKIELDNTKGTKFVITFNNGF